jgi:hypothetical protein
MLTSWSTVLPEKLKYPKLLNIPHILWNPKLHHLIHNSLPPVPILGQIDPVHAPPSNLSKIHFNIIGTHISTIEVFVFSNIRGS